MSVEDDIWAAVVAADEAWVGGRAAEVGDLYAADAVLVTPDLDHVVRGRSAIVQSYEDFAAHAITESFLVDDHHVEVRDDLAVVTYRFTVRYRMDDRTHEEQGQEVLVFRRDQDRWIAVWRTQIPRA